MPKPLVARMKQAAGRETLVEITVVSGTVSYLIPDDVKCVMVAGSSATLTALAVETVQPGREVTLIGKAGASAITITNVDDAAELTPTNGPFDLGGSNITFAEHDVLRLVMAPNGAWLRAAPVADN